VRIRLSEEAIQFLTSTGPFLAEPAKVWLLQRRGLSTRHAVAATVSEYLIYTFTSAAFAIAGLTYLLHNFELSRPASVAAKVFVYAMGTFLLAGICVIIFRIYLIGAMIKGARKLPLIGKHVRLEENDVRDTEDRLFAVLRDRPLRFLSILAVEFAAQAFLVLAVRTPENHGEALFDRSSFLNRSRHQVHRPGLLLHSRPDGRSRGHLRIHFQNGGSPCIRRLRSCCRATASQPPRRRCGFGFRATWEGRAAGPRARITHSRQTVCLP
jgi:hypothetical protein